MACIPCLAGAAIPGALPAVGLGILAFGKKNKIAIAVLIVCALLACTALKGDAAYQQRQSADQHALKKRLNLQNIVTLVIGGVMMFLLKSIL